MRIAQAILKHPGPWLQIRFDFFFRRYIVNNPFAEAKIIHLDNPSLHHLSLSTVQKMAK